MLLKADFGAHLFEKGSDESLNCEKSMDTTGTSAKYSTNKKNIKKAPYISSSIIQVSRNDDVIYTIF